MVESASSRYSAMRLAAMNALARREHSRAELEQKLSARFPDEGQRLATVLEQLSMDGLQCDERFAEAYARAKINRGYGWRHIASALRSKGIADEVARSVYESLGQDWFELAVRALEKRFGLVASKEMDSKEKARRIRFLQYRGFDGEQVRHALEAGAD